MIVAAAETAVIGSKQKHIVRVEHKGSTHYSLNIFASSNIISKRFFFTFSKLFAVFDDFSKWTVPNVLQNSEKSSNIAKIAGK